MNQELANVIKIYSTGTHGDLSRYLIGKSKDTLIRILVDLLTMYIKDKNSSTIREFITVTLAGYQHKESKIGYNGFKQDAFLQDKTIKCEAKPKNVDTEEFEKYKKGERKTSPAKLNGGGNFTDYTPARLDRDKKEIRFKFTSKRICGRKTNLYYRISFQLPKLRKKFRKQNQKVAREIKREQKYERAIFKKCRF